MDNESVIRAVKAAQAYIETHIKEKITLYDIAIHCGYSPWYISRIFKQHTGVAMFDYIRAVRLSKAALTLRDYPVRVIDVALDYMFDSHEGFTRAFSRQFGLAPKNYQDNTPPIKLFIPYPVSDSSVKLGKGERTMDKKTNTIFVQVLERPQRKLILKRGKAAKNYYEYCDEVDGDVWGLLCSIKQAINEPMGLWMPKSLQPKGTAEYAMGVEVPIDYTGEIPDGFDIIELKPCKMMVFQGEPFDDAQFEQAISDLWEVISRYDPTRYGFEWADEDAPRFQLEPQGFRGYMEGKPVRLVK